MTQSIDASTSISMHQSSHLQPNHLQPIEMQYNYRSRIMTPTPTPIPTTHSTSPLPQAMTMNRHHTNNTHSSSCEQTSMVQNHQSMTNQPWNNILSLTGDLQRSNQTRLLSTQDRSETSRPISKSADPLPQSNLERLNPLTTSNPTPNFKGLHIGYTLPDSTNNFPLRNESRFQSNSTTNNTNSNPSHCIPQPNIMPRPNSINGRTGIMPSPRSSGGNFNFSRSTMSAFSSPSTKMFMDGSSPVPSVIASDCSLPSRTPSFNFNDFDQSSNVYDQWGAGGMYGSSVSMKPSLQISPRNQAYFVAKKTSSSHDYSYFTPIAHEQSEPYFAPPNQLIDQDITSGFQTPLPMPDGFYPQCQEIPRSISMRCSSTNDHKINTADTIPAHSRNDGLANSNNNDNFDPTLYCRPIDCNMQSNFIMTRPHTNEPIMKTLQLQDEPPQRTRKISTDSAESNLTSFRSLSSEESFGSLPQLPQNLKGDPHRQAKVKTELCLHYARGKSCPFGSRCNYAHGEHQLKYTKLFELQKAGLVEDISSYRCHPCASWVSTGSCPFGLRCHNLHDPRVASECPSWLPHSDIPTSNIQTDLTVDKSYHQEQAILNQANPLVHNLLWAHRPSQKKNTRSNAADGAVPHTETEWKDTYSMVCNMANLYSWKKSSNKGSSALSKKISELEKLCIAMKMSYSSASKPTHLNFVYKAKYTVYDELCMVLQSKYFLLLRPSQIDNVGESSIDSVVREITVKEYESRTSAWNKQYPYTPNNVVSVKELTFGCLGEPSSKVSLWFDLPDPVLLSNQEIKRFKRNRQRMLQETTRYDHTAKLSVFPGMKYVTDSNNKSFESHPHKPFFHMRPSSNDVTKLNLITDILMHRISVLLRRKFKKSGCDSKSMSIHPGFEDEILMRFQNIKKDSMRWQWPVSEGRTTVDASTSVPSCATKYNPSKDTDASRLWHKFLFSIKPADTIGVDKKMRNSSLTIFSKLSRGISIHGSGDRTIMHIKSIANDDISNNEVWKYISGDDEKSEWNLIKNHYLHCEQGNKDGHMPLSSPQGEKLTKN